MSAHPMDTAVSVPVPVPVPVDRFACARRSAPAGPVRPQGRSAGWERWWLGALVLGALAWLLATIALPVASLLGRSFWDDTGRFTGLAQFITYARMPGVTQSLFNSLWLSAVSSTVCVLLAYAYAYGVVRSCMPLARWFRALALVPLLAPSLLMAISLIYLFGSQGLLKGWLQGARPTGPSASSWARCSGPFRMR